MTSATVLLGQAGPGLQANVPELSLEDKRSGMLNSPAS
jgi:hypothetical protein